MANESPQPWDPNPQPQGPVGITVPPQLENHLQPPETGDFSKAAEVLAPHQIVVPPAPTPDASASIKTALGPNGEVSIQNPPAIENPTRTQPMAENTTNFDAKKFLEGTPVMNSAEKISQPAEASSPAGQSAAAAVPLEVGAQTLVAGSESGSQTAATAETEQVTSDNDYPMAEGSEIPAATPAPAEAIAPVVAAQDAPVPVEAPVGLPTQPAAVESAPAPDPVPPAAPVVAETPPETLVSAPQSVGTMVESESTTNNSTAPKNWKKFGETLLTNTIQSVNTRVATAINNSVGPKPVENASQADVKPATDVPAGDESTISPFGDELPKAEGEEPQEMTNITPFPQRTASEVPSTGTAQTFVNEVRSDVPHDDGQPSPNREPTPIPTRAMNEYLTTPTEAAAVNTTAMSGAELMQIRSEVAPTQEKKITNFEEYRAEKLERIRKAREIELLKIAYHKDAAEKAEKADRALLGQQEYIQSLDPISFATVDNALNGVIPDIDRLTIEELEKAA